MKIPAFAALSLGALSQSVISRDFIPPHWIENVEATDTSIQQCIVFATTKGVLYTVEQSNDLESWIPDETFGANGEIYGMSHQCVVPMREFTPPSSPSSGGGSSGGLPLPNVSIRFQRSSSSSGGTVATWPSLSGDGSVSILIQGEMDDGWDNLPLFWDEMAGYRMFVWHSFGSTPSPQQQLLSPEDEALHDALVANFLQINSIVDLEQENIRNTPPRAPNAPDSKIFWRIRADWNIDTDGDGCPDWTEFELQDDPSHPSHIVADPFDKDVNGDGIADGAQIDLDRDGTPDVIDVFPGDGQISSPIIPTPRYALFNITNAAPNVGWKSAIQINDQGTVLFVDGTWSGGKWTKLESDGGSIFANAALSINDSGTILGNGIYEYRKEPESRHIGTLVTWETPASPPTRVGNGNVFAFPTSEQFSGSPSGHFLSNDRHTLALTATLQEDDPEKPDISITEKPHLWALSGTSSPGPGEEQSGMYWLASKDLFWGRGPDGEGIFSGPGSPPDLPEPPAKVVYNGNIYAFYRDGSGYSQILNGSTWKNNFSYGLAVDVSSDGTTIRSASQGMTAPAVINGKAQPIADVVKPAPAAWLDPTVRLIDTTPGGWILAARGGIESPDHSVLLPLRLQGIFEGPADAQPPQPLRLDSAGVDDISMTSSNPGENIDNRIWIMGPLGTGETRVKLRSPLSAACNLELSGEGLKFNNQDTLEISSTTTEFTVSASSGQTGSELPLILKIKNGGTSETSSTTPIGVKLMKRRTMNVKVWIVKYDDGSLPQFNPSKKDLDDYLNGIYEPQLNLHFNCTLESLNPLGGWDTAVGKDFGAPNTAEGNGTHPAQNKTLDIDFNFFGPEPAIIKNAGYTGTLDVNLYIVGGARSMVARRWDVASQQIKSSWPVAGFARDDDQSCWVRGECSLIEGLDTVAHEIGHLLVGKGHPNSKEEPGIAELPGTNQAIRLMAEGGKKRFKDGRERLLVKGEWDEAEKRLGTIFQKP